MPPDYSRTAPATTLVQSVSKNLALLTLRLTTGCALLFWHGWKEGFTAWSHLWSKTPWHLPTHLASLGFPLPFPLALTLVLVTLLTSLFLVMGLLTRLSAIILAALSAITVVLYAANPGIAETAFLYGGACLAISFGGGGSYSMDTFLRAVTPKRSSAKI